MEKPIFKCTCKNSNCLKFYCECFANGKFCDNCNCQNCKNTQENKDLRLEKYNLIISRNPKALQKINSTKGEENMHIFLNVVIASIIGEHANQNVNVLIV